MRILIADDERVTRTILIRTLERDFDVLPATDGESAWTLVCEQRPPIAILDWMLPELDGLSLCRRARQHTTIAPLHILLLSARDSRSDLVEGLDAGADDYLIKPFDRGELKARVNAGVRMIGLQQKLAERVTELQAALTNVRQLQGLLPICSYCKAIRSDNDYWQQIDTYITLHSDAQFSHGICPTCLKRAFKDVATARPKRRRRTGPAS